MCLIGDISIPSAAIFIFLRCLFHSKRASAIQHWPVCFPTNSPFTLNNLLNVSNFQSPWIFLSRFRLFFLHLMLLHKSGFQNCRESAHFPIYLLQPGWRPTRPTSCASRADKDTLPKLFQKPLSSCVSPGSQRSSGQRLLKLLWVSSALTLLQPQHFPSCAPEIKSSSLWTVFHFYIGP